MPVNLDNSTSELANDLQALKMDRQKIDFGEQEEAKTMKGALTAAQLMDDSPPVSPRTAAAQSKKSKKDGSKKRRTLFRECD